MSKEEINMSEEKVTLNDLAEGAVQTATPTGMPVRKKLWQRTRA